MAATRRECVRAAAELLHAFVSLGITRHPYIYPTRSGGVQFEWEQGSKYLEIEVLDGHSAAFYYEGTDARIGQEQEFGLDSLPADLLNQLRLFK